VSFARNLLNLEPLLSSYPGPLLFPFDDDTLLLPVELTDQPDYNNIVDDWTMIASTHTEIQDACKITSSRFGEVLTLFS
jgi:hypothetical protein